MLPTGTVSFSTTLTIPAYCTIQGQGMGVSKLLLAANTQLISPAAITNTREPLVAPGTLDNNINLTSFTLDLNTADQTSGSAAIWMANVDFFNMDGIEVNGGMVHLGGATSITDNTVASYTHDISITNSVIHNAGVVPFIAADALQLLALNVKVSNNTLGPSTDSGIGLLGAGTSNIQITDNTFTGNPQTCGVAGGPTVGNVPGPPNAGRLVNYVTITGNTILCGGSAGFGINGALANHWVIANNIITNIAASNGSQVSPAIALEAVTDITITGNSIIGAQDGGIYIMAQSDELTENVVISGNTIRNPNKYGILLESFSDTNPGSTLANVTVSGNVIVDPGVGGAYPGIEVAQDGFGGGIAAYRNVIITGNSILDDRLTPTMNYGILYLGCPTVTVGNNAISGATIAPSSTNCGLVTAYFDVMRDPVNSQ